MPYKDPVVRAAYHREYKRRNRWRYAGRQRVWDAARHANERAIQYGAAGVITPEEAAAILATGACVYCGATERLSLDHVISLDRRGPNRPENIVCACVSCNISKFRSDRPGRWSQTHDQCVDCGTTARRHGAEGRCIRCYTRNRENAIRSGEFIARPRKPEPPHGTRRRYDWRYDPCRCDECKAAIMERSRRRRARRAS